MALQKMSEGIDYHLEPTEDGNEAGWNVRLSSRFPETVVRFGNVSFNPENDCLNFSFVLLSTPESELSEEDEDLQQCVGDVLENVLENAINDKALVVNERDTDTKKLTD